MSKLRVVAVVAVLCVLALVAPPGAAAAGAKLGVVLLHGKGGASAAPSPVGKLATALEGEGFVVVAPDMPWSKSRGLDAPFAEALAEIDAAVTRLKGLGAEKIVVAGHSLGANVAIAYGARRDGIAGVLAMAPGHPVEDRGFQGTMHDDYKRAKERVAAGKGDEKDDFADMNQGRASTLRTTAKIYFGWYDPDGDLVMPKNAAGLKPGTALMWIVGKDDRIAERGEAYAFARAPANAKSVYAVVPGGHMATPQKGERRIVEWLKSLQ